MSVHIQDEFATEASSAIRVTGEGATAYLQGQLTQDVTSVAETAWSLLLEPDGSVIVRLLVRRREDGFDLLVPQSLAESSLTRLRRFALRARCEFALRDPVPGPWATLSDRLVAGAPGAGEFVAALPAQSYGARVIEDSVSFTKGCYTGQELVARLDSRAAPVPWRLVRVRARSLALAQAALSRRGPEGPRGVTSAVSSHDGVLALGFAHRTLDPEDLGSEDVSVEFL